MSKKTVVLGASPNPERYSNRAVKMLKKHGHEVVALGPRAGEIDGEPILAERPKIDDVDTVTLYLGAQRQAAEQDFILSLAPRRIIFNPGAENDDLFFEAQKRGIETVEGCTLVMLSVGTF